MAKQTFTTGQVLLASQLTSLQQTAMLGGSASNKTSSYTLVAADAGTAISMTSTSATTITVNTGLFAAGDTVQITNLGTGVSTITAGTATVNSSAALALAQYESGTLDFTSASAAIFIKGAGAAAGGGGKSYSLLNAGGTALSGGSTSITGITGQDDLVVIVAGASFTAATRTLALTFNSDTGSNYFTAGGNYMKTDNISQFNGAFTEITLSRIGNDAAGISSAFLELSGGNSTTGYKKFMSVSGVDDRNDARTYKQGGIYTSTSAITSVQIFGNGTFDAGTVYIYGSA